MAQAMLPEMDEQDQLMVQQVMAEEDIKQTTQLFTKVSSIAFKECVNNFRGRTLDKSESKCIENIVSKYMEHFQRINIRFGEVFTQNAQAAAAQQQQGPK